MCRCTEGSVVKRGMGWGDARLHVPRRVWVEGSCWSLAGPVKTAGLTWWR